jgi:transposase-like protein
MVRKEGVLMGRPKGGTNRIWSDEDRARIVARYMEGGLGKNSLAAEENVPAGTLRGWIRRFLEEGEAGLENKRKTGNQYSALHASKALSELERLRLLVLKQEIEIERLKKGYMVEGVGADKVFVTSKGKNTKSSKP